MNSRYKIGDILDVHIEKIVPRGFGLAFAENLTVFVPLSVPDDDLRVRIVEIKKRTAFAEIVEIKQPGQQRVAPPCEYFGRCGGCDFQQMDYATQLEAKVGIIRDCLHRIGKIEYYKDISVIPSPQQFGYRSRARWHIDRDKQVIGYYARDSHDVIDITTCPILMPELQATLESVRTGIEWNMIFDESSELETATDEKGTASIFSSELNEPLNGLSFSINGDVYFYSAETFFQANKFLIGELINAAIGGAAGETALDLYCGVGLFTLPLTRTFKNVVAIEENPTAVSFAKKNAEDAKIICKNVGRFLSENKTNVDFVLIDPPRSGTEKNVIASIVALKPKQMSYVSCEPSILARDLRMLIDTGYIIENITALDMFPQTHHVETVVRLKKF